MDNVNERMVVLVTKAFKAAFTELAAQNGHSASEEARIAIQEYMQSFSDAHTFLDRLARIEQKIDAVLAALTRQEE